MKLEVIILLVCLLVYVGFVNLSPPLFLTFSHPTQSPEYADKIKKVNVTHNGKDYSLTVFGYDGSKEVSRQQGWSKLLIVKFRSADGFMRLKKFPIPYIQFNIRHVDGNDLVETDRRKNRFALNMNHAQVTISSPGFYGSSGSEEDSFTVEGKKIMSKAVEKLANEFGAESVVLVGGSHPGNIVAGILSFYTKPIHCAIINSAPLDLESPHRNLPYQDYSLRTKNPFNPMNWVSSIPKDENRIVRIAFSRKDSIVDWRMTSVYAQQLLQAGHNVSVEEPTPSEITYYHDQSLWHFNTINSCSDSWINNRSK
ncbi:MAG: hypothetical protein ABNH21_16500 [Glaciecola sp.]